MRTWISLVMITKTTSNTHPVQSHDLLETFAQIAHLMIHWTLQDVSAGAAQDNCVALRFFEAEQVNNNNNNKQISNDK